MAVSTHSRPKAAGSEAYPDEEADADVSTHSRPKAAGPKCRLSRLVQHVSTHSRPKAAGQIIGYIAYFQLLFQHTAARRRLVKLTKVEIHSVSFNTQPPEGGWLRQRLKQDDQRFNTQPPEGGWEQTESKRRANRKVSTHSRPKAAGNTRV